MCPESLGQTTHNNDIATRCRVCLFDQFSFHHIKKYTNSSFWKGLFKIVSEQHPEQVELYLFLLVSTAHFLLQHFHHLRARV